MAPASSARAQRRPRPVVFDSSFLVSVMERPTTWKEDITDALGAFQPVVLSSVKKELASLASKGDKRGRFANLALTLIEEGMFSIELDGGGKPDDEIVSFALKEHAAVATVDAELAKTLRASRAGPLVSLRAGRVSV